MSAAETCSLGCLVNSGKNRASDIYIWVFPKIGAPQNAWFIMGNTIRMDDLGVPLFSETSIYIFKRT